MTVAIYMRLSLEDSKSKNESNSITNQRILIKEFIKKNLEFAKSEVIEYCDDGYSGVNFERPGVTKLLEDIKKNLINCIIVKDFSRFSRDYIDMGTYLDKIFPFMGVRFISISDNYDNIYNVGATIGIDTAFKSLLNDFYSKDISVKIKTVFQNKCSNGEYIFGQTPFGYEKIPDKKNQIRINEKEAKVVKYIYELSAGGMTPVAIEKRLYKEKVPTCSQMRGKVKDNGERINCWSSEMVRKVLDNRFYIGDFIYHKAEAAYVGSNEIKRLPKSEWITIPNHHEAIVSNDLFEKAKYNKSDRSTKRKYPKHPLTGKLYCGGCGYSMVYKRTLKGEPYQRFECRKHALLQIASCCVYIKSEILEELLLTMFNREVMKMADLKKSKDSLMTALKSRMNVLCEKIQLVNLQMVELEQKKARTYEDYVEGLINADEYKQMIEMINKTVKEKKDSIECYKMDLDETKKAYNSNLDDLKNILKYSKVNELTQDIVDEFFSKIKVYRDRTVEIEWAFSCLK